MEAILAEMGKHNVAIHEEEDEDVDSEEQESDADDASCSKGAGGPMETEPTAWYVQYTTHAFRNIAKFFHLMP